MAIRWSQERRRAVAKIIAEDRKREERNCARVAKGIWPHAVAHDLFGSKRWQLWPDPDDGFYLPRKASIGRPWDWHVVVETALHCVDTLTDVDGHAAGERICEYLAAHYEAPGSIIVEPWEGKPIITDSQGRRRQ